MVATRTQTGTLARKSYKPGFLELNVQDSDKPGPAGKKSPKKHKIGKAPQKVRFRSVISSPSATPSKAPPSPLPEGSLKDLQRYLKTTASALPGPEIDFCEGSYAWPKMGWGEEEPVGLSRIQRAEKEIQVWEGVWACHFGEEAETGGEEKKKEDGQEELRTFIKAKLEDAIKNREALEKTEENLRIG
jgi:hypothetical protein